jgi:hypothetical protein
MGESDIPRTLELGELCWGNSIMDGLLLIFLGLDHRLAVCFFFGFLQASIEGFILATAWRVVILIVSDNRIQ